MSRSLRIRSCKAFIPVALLAAVFALVLTACGAGANGSAAAQDGSASGGTSTASASAESAPRGSTLTVGVRADIAGMSQLNQGNGQYYGMEIDLAREMASRMGYRDVEFVTVTPESRKETLLSGKVDCIVACYSAGGTRSENFDFSPAYYEDHIVLVCENSSLITGVDGLKGGTIGTVAGANTAPYLAKNLTERGFTAGEVLQANKDNTDVTFDTWHLKEYDTYQELSDALESGEVDAMAMDGVIANAYMDSSRSILSDYEAAPQEYAVATNKGSDLSSSVAATIQDMLDDGTVAALIDKWN